MKIKNGILIGSGAAALLASTIAIVAVLTLQPSEISVLSTVRANMIAGYLGLLSVSLFFVGVAFPRE